MAKVYEFVGAEGGEKRLQIEIPLEKLPEPKVSPKQGWSFEWVVAALGRHAGGSEPYRPKFRVYSQMRKTEDDPAPYVARMALRLWDFNVKRLRLEHNPSVNLGIFDFYLCFGGKPGGEQQFAEDPQTNPPQRVNTMYIYAVQTFTDPLEMAREIAHEYGHAALPPIGGFKTPEDWANGYLGERLYLKWMSDEISAKRLYPDDAMAVPEVKLKAWLKRNVDPLIAQAAATGPDANALSKTGKKAMDLYLGLALFAEEMLPPGAFARSLKLTGSTAAFDYPKAIVAAATEVQSLLINVPEYLRDKKIWVPLGKGKWSGNVQILQRRGDWAQVTCPSGSFRIENPKLPD